MEKLQYISQGNSYAEQLHNIEKVLDYGVKWIQVRWKKTSEKDLLQLSEKVVQMAEIYGATVIINDDVKISKAVNADGVHLGLEDTSVADAKFILRKGRIVGGTANTFEDVLKRIEENCDYIGLGPLRFTSTKKKLSPILGFEGYQKIIEKLSHNPIPMPKIFAIGGITVEDLPKLMNTGIYGVAVSGEITRQPKIIEKYIKILHDK